MRFNGVSSGTQADGFTGFPRIAMKVREKRGLALALVISRDYGLA